MKPIIYVFAFFILLGSSSAQDAWINYTNNYVITDIEEFDGGMWLGSRGGLCYVNTLSGEEIYYNRGNSEIPSNNIHDLLLHPNNDLWVATSRGLCIWRDGQIIKAKQKITGHLRLTPDNKVMVTDSDSIYIQTSEMNFESIAYPDHTAAIGGIEISSDGSIYLNAVNYYSKTYVAVYKNKQWKIIYSADVYKSALTMDSKDKVWFLTEEGLHHWENNTWIKDLSIDSLYSYSIKKIHVDKEDNIIMEIGRQCPKVLLWDGSVSREIDFVQGNCKKCGFIKPSLKSKDTYFAYNYDKGLYTLSSQSKGEFKAYTQSPLYSNRILTTLHPTDGSHWIVYYNKKIEKITNNKWSDVPLPADLTKTIRFAFLSKESIYISDAENIWVYADKKWNKHNLPSLGFTSKIELMHIGDDGILWIQYGTYIAKYKEKWIVYGPSQHRITNSLIQDIVVDPENGDLWVSSFQGVRKYDGGIKWQKYNMPPINFSYSLAIANDGIYVYSSDLYFIHDDIIDSIPMPTIGDYTYSSKMTYDRTKERLYLSGFNCLAVLENDTWEVFTWNNSGVYNGFSNDLNIDNEGNLWLSGESGGLNVFNPSGIALSTSDDDQTSLSNLVELYPSVITEGYTRLRSLIGGSFKISLFDMDGKLIKADNIFLPAQTEVVYRLPQCPKGRYFLKITSKEGTTTQKIINFSY